MSHPINNKRQTATNNCKCCVTWQWQTTTARITTTTTTDRDLFAAQDVWGHFSLLAVILFRFIAVGFCRSCHSNASPPAVVLINYLLHTYNYNLYTHSDTVVVVRGRFRMQRNYWNVQGKSGHGMCPLPTTIINTCRTVSIYNYLLINHAAGVGEAGIGCNATFNWFFAALFCIKYKE